MIKKILPIGKGFAKGFLMTPEKIFMSKEKNAESAYGQIRNRVKYFAQKCAGRKAIKYDEIRAAEYLENIAKAFVEHKLDKLLKESEKQNYINRNTEDIYKEFASSKDAA